MKTARPLPPKFLAAMIAVLPLPGSPLYNGDDQRVIGQALADLEVYKEAGVDSIIFENDHDLPYIQPPLDEKGITLMTEIVKEARKRFEGPLGVQMLEAANITSLEIAAEAGSSMVLPGRSCAGEKNWEQNISRCLRMLRKNMAPIP